MKNAIAYIRKSTDKGQTHSFDRQLNLISDFAKSEGITISQTFVEQASGKSSTRPELLEALEICRKTNTPLIVSSISRLSRDVSFGSGLLSDPNLKIIVSDLGVEADPFLLNVLLCVAQKEREMISKRTKDGMAAAKAKGVKLGNPNWSQSLSKARQAKTSLCIQRDRKYLQLINLIQSAGTQSYRGIARKMNDMDIKSPKGRSISPVFVRNVLMRSVDVGTCRT